MIRILVILGAGFIIISLFMYFKQEDLIFIPSKNYLSPPEKLGIEEVVIDTADGERLFAWWSGALDDADTIIFFHGNAGNISGRLPQAELFGEMGYNFLIFDYRGYGKSTGEIEKEEDIYTDSLAVYEYVRKEKGVDPGRIILWGRSLGGAAAIHLAGEREVKILVAESTFNSVEELAGHLYPHLPAGYLLKYRFVSGEKVGSVDAPKLFLHSKEDEIVPYEQGVKLYENASEPKEFIELEGGHNDFHTEVYEKEVKNFIERY